MRMRNSECGISFLLCHVSGRIPTRARRRLCPCALVTVLTPQLCHAFVAWDSKQCTTPTLSPSATNVTKTESRDVTEIRQSPSE
jgi:hypothetical protein